MKRFRHMTLTCIAVLLLIGNTMAAGELKPLTREQLAWEKVKVATVQMTGKWRWKAPTAPQDDPADEVVRYVDRAGAEGVQLIVFPELLLGQFKVPNASTDKIARAAARNRLYVVAGCFEVLDKQGTYANSTLVFGRDGKIIGRHFKVHPAIGNPPTFWPPKPDDAEWTMKRGTSFEALDLDFGRIGIVTCYDGYFPESFRSSALNGAEILIWVNAREGAVEDFIVKSAMFQNEVSMITCNKAVGGGTMIAQWPTTILQQTTEPGERYLSAELALHQMRWQRKYGTKYHSRHPEAYRNLQENQKVYAMYDQLPPLAGAPPAMIELTPQVIEHPVKRKKGMTTGTDLYHLAFHAKAEWMSEGITLRLPEVLQSSMGMHFIDHFNTEIWPLSEPEPFPQWRKDEVTGAVNYTCRLREGVEFGARAVPDREEVELELYVTNHSDKPLKWVQANPCLILGSSPEMCDKFDLTKLYAFYGGKLQTLEHTTPTPAQMKRAPWLLMLTRQGVGNFTGPKISPTWWLLDQVADMNLMAAESRDGKHLVGYTWDTPDKHMMSNGGNPCLHTGPGELPELAPGQTHTWRGKLYLLKNDPAELLRRVKADRARWGVKEPEQAKAGQK